MFVDEMRTKNESIVNLWQRRLQFDADSTSVEYITKVIVRPRFIDSVDLHGAALIRDGYREAKILSNQLFFIHARNFYVSITYIFGVLLAIHFLSSFILVGTLDEKSEKIFPLGTFNEILERIFSVYNKIEIIAKCWHLHWCCVETKIYIKKCKCSKKFLVFMKKQLVFLVLTYFALILVSTQHTHISPRGKYLEYLTMI